MARLSLEDIVASNPKFKNVDINKTREYYNDAMRQRNNTTTLPEVIVTGKRKSINKKRINLEDINWDISTSETQNIIKQNRNNQKRWYDYGIKNFEETFGINPRTIADYIPVLGDVLSINNINNDLNNGDYKSAILNAGMLAVPNIIERPTKLLFKYGKKVYNTVSNKIGFIPGMSFSDKKRTIKHIYNEYYDKVLPNSESSFLKRQDILSQKYILPNDFIVKDINDIAPHYVSIKRGDKSYNLQGKYEGANFDTDFVVTLNSRKHPLFFKSPNKILGVSRHEVDHTIQEMLGDRQALKLKPDYKTRLLNNNPIYTNVDNSNTRAAIVDIGTNAKGKTYTGIPRDNFFANPLEIDNNGNISEVIKYFNPLVKHRTRNTYIDTRNWIGSPSELQSEVARHIDFSTKNNAGKIYKELSDKDKNVIIKLISKRFKLNPNDTKNVLFNAGRDGYLKYGGQIDNFN